MISNRRRLQFLFIPLVITAMYTFSVVGFSRQKFFDFWTLFDSFFAPTLYMWLCLGMIALFVDLVQEMARSARRPVPIYFRDQLYLLRNPATQILHLSPPLIFALLMAAYCLFKQTVIPTSGFWAGPYIMATEHQILFGHHAWEITHSLFPASASYWFEKAYQLWMPMMVCSMLICSHLSGDPVRRCRFLLCFIATWIIIGTMLAYMLPAAGPVYLSEFHNLPDSFHALKQTLVTDSAVAQQISGQGLLTLRSQASLLNAIRNDILIPGGGISAMPSMHNAIAVTLACAAFSINRLLGWLLAAFAAIIFVASVHLGWHYALDGIVSAVVSIGLWLSSERIVQRYERRHGVRRNDARGGRRRVDRQSVPAALPVTA